MKTTHEIDAIKAQLSATPEVQQCYYVTGEADIVLVMVVASMTHYEELSRRLFIENDAVRKFRTFVSMDRVKAKMEVALLALEHLGHARDCLHVDTGPVPLPDHRIVGLTRTKALAAFPAIGAQVIGGGGQNIRYRPDKIAATVAVKAHGILDVG